MLEQTEIDRMADALTQRGISHAEFCRACNIDKATWLRLRQHAFHPSYRTAQAIKAAYARLTAGAAE